MFAFTQMNEGHLEKVLQWRTQPDVTRYMFTDMEYNVENQSKWFGKIMNTDTEKYWVISYKNIDIGVISLNGIDWKHKRASSGYYIGEPDYRLYGGLIPPYLYNYVFHELGLNKVAAEVMEGNTNIMKLHLMHQYREVGVLRQHIYKYEQYHDVHLFELTQEDWKRAEAKYKKYVANFDDDILANGVQS